MSSDPTFTLSFRGLAPRVAQASGLCAQPERLCYLEAGLRNLLLSLIPLGSGPHPHPAFSKDSQGGKQWDSWNE
jgi:hypothetical protein